MKSLPNYFSQPLLACLLCCCAILFNNQLSIACNNVCDGGQICCNEIHCGPYNPANIYSAVDPSGGSGAIEYMWLSTTNCSLPVSQWNVISGANSSNYNPGFITQTTCYLRCSRRSCCSNWVGESNIVTKVVGSSGTVQVTGTDPTCAGSDGSATASYSGSCTYTVKLFDTYGDGWSYQGNTNYLTIYLNGNPALSNIYLTGGHGPEYYHFTPGQGDVITASYVQNDGYGYENYYRVYDENMNLIFSDGCGGNGCAPSSWANVGTGNCSSSVSYAWSNGGTTQTITGLGAGIYTVTVTDGSCSATGSTTLTAPTNCCDNLTDGGQICCDQTDCGPFNPTTINSHIDPSGGTGNLEILWLSTTNCTLPVSQWNVISGATGLTYNPSTIYQTTCYIRCSRREGCTNYVGESNIVTMTIVPEIVVNCVKTSGNCSNGNMGSMTANVNGGTGPFTYAWSNGSTTSSISNLSAGSYSVTVTDVNGCTDQCTKTISTDPCCNLTDGGTICCDQSHCGPFDPAPITSTLNPSGGLGALEIVWLMTTNCSLPVSQWTMISGGTGLTYDPPTIYQTTCYIRCARRAGCTNYVGESNVVTMTVFPEVVVTCSKTNGNCNNGNLGSISTNVSGGTGPFTYAWSNGSATSGISNLTAGTYSVTVTDANGCTDHCTKTISTDPCCNLTDGGAICCDQSHCGPFDPAPITSTVNPSGGLGALEIIWLMTTDCSLPVSQWNVISGAVGLTYDPGLITQTTCYIRCARRAGCTDYIGESNIVTMTVYGALNVIAIGTNPNCAEECDGSVNVSVIGGTAPYVYNWSNGSTHEDLNNLCAGTYTVTVTAANGCTGTASATLVDPPGLSSFITGTDASCSDVCDGAADLTVTGGTGPFNYIWSNGMATEDLTGLCAGAYGVTVTDANGCLTTSQVTISEPTPFNATFVHHDVTCYGACDGGIDLTLYGGTPPYSFNWSNGVTTKDLSGLCPGVYSITIEDDNGCRAVIICDTIGEPSELITSIVGTDNACSNVCKGAADLTVSGGTTPYSFAWNNGETTEDVGSLCVGTYSVTVTDHNQCTSVASVTISQLPELLATASGSDVSCAGECDGAVDLSVSGGTSPFSYSWSNGDNTEDLSGLCAGTYAVTVIDANNCSATAIATVNEPGTLSASVSPTDASCKNYCNGTIDLTVSGGTPPYSYLWSSGDVTEDLTGLCAGSYSVVVTDANGCTISRNATIDQPTMLHIFLNPTNPLCAEDCNGSIDATITGGTPPYSFSWTTGQATEDISNLCEGGYKLRVFDANGCMASDSTYLADPTDLMASYTKNDVSCNGNCDGSIDLNLWGGTPPYTFSWSNGSTMEDQSGLCAGTYTVTVYDQHQCITTKTISIEESSALQATAQGTDPLCAESCDGSADLTVSGGDAPYSYLWSNGATTEDLSNLCEGTYMVTAMDANGCSAVASVTLTDPTDLTSSSTHTDVTCHGACDGSIDVTVSGGTPPYTYSWNDGNTNEDRSGLCAGTYSVTVYDANQCLTIQSATITEPPVLNASITGTDATCHAFCDGLADLTVTGGTPPYTYAWNNGAATEDISGLCAGAYGVVVTDANGCTVSKNVSIAEPSALQLTLNPTNPLCAEDCDGSIDATVSGGTPPYTFAWSSGQNTEDISNLCEGGYRLHVTDANGCMATDSVYLTDPADLMATFTKTDVSCNGNCDGSIDLAPSGGTPPYSYNWSNGSNTEDQSGLCAGTYTVTIYDNHQCLTTKVVTITESSALISSVVGTDPLCAESCDGSADLTVSGGDAPYSYLWSNGTMTEDLSNLCEGAYMVTVMDASGCSAVESVTLTDPDDLNSSSTPTHVSCYGACDGSIDVSVSGGTPPYTYSWNDGAATEDRSGLCAGSYGVTILDAHQCMTSQTVTITEPALLTASATGSDATCNTFCDGSADLTVSGGTAPYSYAWSDGSTNEDAVNLCAGSHDVTVTDANGCTATANVTIYEPSPLDGGFSSTDASCHNLCDGTASSNPSGGTPPYTYSWSTGETTMSISGLCAGTYHVFAFDANQCRIGQTFTISEPTALQASVTPIQPTCGSDCNGGADLTVSGGTPPYTYGWSNGTSQEDVSNVCGGTYLVIVNDANGCTASATVTLNDAGNLDVNVIGSDASCFGGSDGSADLTVIGGVGPFTYLWSTGETTEDISGLTAGSYSVIVTDAAGCLESANVAIGEPSAIQAGIQGTDPTCGSDCNGSADLTVSGGTPPYSYAWSNGSTMQDISNLCGGTYSVVVTDANGCTASASTTLTDVNNMSATATATDASCNGGSDGSVDLTVTGGVAPYTYLWSNGATTEDISGLSAGTYSVIVTDASGCLETASATIGEPTAVQASAIGTDPRCAEECDGSIDLTVSGGTPPYTYSWSNGANTEDISNLCAGAYDATVTDANGCTASAGASLTDPQDLSLSATTDSTSCTLACDGAINLTVSGGTPPYTYNWSNGATVEDPSGLCVGIYFVTVYDANQCFTSSSVPVYPNPALLIFKSKTNVSCYGMCDGTIDVLPLGGTPPYVFTWAHGATGQFLTGLCAGPYYVTVTDGLGCANSTSYVITQPDSLILAGLAYDNTLCAKLGDGSIDIIVSGGTLPYYYQWSNGASTEDISGLTADWYTVTVTDFNNCTISGSWQVKNSAPISVNEVITHATCDTTLDGAIDITVSGGTPPYDFNWSTAETTEDISGLGMGTYSLIITDAGGCVEVFNFTVNGGNCNSFNNWTVGRDDSLTEAPVDNTIMDQMFEDNGGTPGNGKGIGSGSEEKPEHARLYQNVPNPFSQVTMIRFELPESTVTAMLRVTDVVGKQIQLIDLMQLENQQFTLNANDIAQHNQVLFYSLMVDGKLVATKRLIVY